jgi:hypothetical protein
MPTPDFTEGLVAGDNPVAVEALYRDVLHRVLGGSEDFALDTFTAWEICKDLQRLRRLGSHALADQRVEQLKNRHEQMAAEWEEVDHRTRARRQVLASVNSLLDLYKALCPSKQVQKLRVVGE